MSDRRIGGIGPSAKALAQLQSENRDLRSQLEAIQQENEVLRSANAGLAADLGDANNKLGRLQRENEELKAAIKPSVTRSSCVQCADMEQQIEKLKAANSQIRERYRAANSTIEYWKSEAITPEMRERMGALLLAFDEGFLEMEEAAMNGINIIRSLLGERGGEG